MKAKTFLAMSIIIATASFSRAQYETSYEAGSESELGHLSRLEPMKSAGIDATIWAWATYSRASDGGDKDYSWGGELEFDLSKTIGDRFTLATDIEIIDYDDLKYGKLEQLFARVKLVDNVSLTLGKFNSPWGMEARDFWDRTTGTPTLLFRAQPQDLRGAMVDVELGETHVTLRPFVVSGFNDEDSIPGRPSAGLMVAYEPNKQWNFGVTGWWGPGLKNNQVAISGGGQTGGYYIGDVYYPPIVDPNTPPVDQSAYASSVFGLTNTWENPDYNSSHDGKLYFIDATVSWKPRENLTLSAEYLLASSDGDDASQFWDGVGVIGSYEIDRHWLTFAHWSYLNDRDGAVSGITQNLQAVGIGGGYRITRYIELRAEYRHDFSDQIDDVDSVSVHASIGY